ncbi:ATPase family associated with various cellular activities (AAA) [Sinosporangium album]|uniref:ATPase family associated with various cellular activities (AAA) n=1 Tax=Sinosporangium album TaxID=504805 RepID=A0A1G7QT88_9ACTN|nr:ATP-binding protein [Sinosporangium album]SDG01741.1 ATPase family associated with various cellular activities (AAA) [Sinosporangium album]
MDPHDARALAHALKDLVKEAHRTIDADRPEPELLRRVKGHLKADLKEIVCVTESFPAWDHASLQRGLDAYLAAREPLAEWFGVSGQNRDDDFVNMLMVAQEGWQSYDIGAVDYSTVAVGPDETMEVVTLGLVLTFAPDGTPVVFGLRNYDGGEIPQCRLEVLTASRSAGGAARDEVTRLMREHNVFRGQVLTFGWSEHRGNQLVTFLPRTEVTADQVVLPDGVLASVERHVAGIGAEAARLLSHGQHLKRGLLLHGPPGTGKTHTVRYLMGRMTESTVIVMTGSALRFISHAAALARQLQPAIVVAEDVDLVARDRSYDPEGNPLLFTLLDAMDGVGADADVTFVLTTNRAGILERALAERPGRVDLAVEVPKPDAAGRLALLRLYARELTLPDDLDELVDATEDMTASFFKELLRRAVLRALGERETVTALEREHLAEALAEMLDERQALTRSLLGGGGSTDHDDHDEDDDYEDGFEGGPVGPGLAPFPGAVIRSTSQLMGDS